MTILDQLASAWDQLIRIATSFIVPDWGALIALLPVFLVILVVGPAVTLAVLAWFAYVVRAPRPRVAIEEGPRPTGRPTGPPPGGAAIA